MVRVGVGRMLASGLLSQGDRRSDARCAWRGSPRQALVLVVIYQGNRERVRLVPPARVGNLEELVRVHRFGTESLQRGRFSLRGRERAGAPFCPPPPLSPLKGVGFLRACLLAALPSRAFPPPCERDARAPSTRDAGNAGVPPAMPTAREKTYPFKLCPPLLRGGRGGTRGFPLPRRGRGAGGEGEKSAPVPHAANPSAVPLSDLEDGVSHQS